ncbi:MAG: thioether cross-link-forming SCIFF peptide maturase [Lachnospiraceae bacterium]|nr:thioether cross-link-forming SCIFF peptide maturase [Lachnospiraceae bacterium]
MLHKFSYNGVNILIDVDSGAIHIADDIVYDIAESVFNLPAGEIYKKFPKYSEGEIDEAISEVKSLAENNMIFTEESYDMVREKLDNKKPVVKALCLHVAHDCNLKCRYCFAEEGEYHGKRALMSFEVGKAALDFLVKNSGNRVNLEVDFFGGEPLMNFDVVKKLVLYGRSIEKENKKNFRFTITTNGILLNSEIEEFINENMQNIVLSADGRKSVNDKMRPTASGAGSYDIIMPKFKRIADRRTSEGKDYYIRSTFTRYNKDFSNDVLHFADIGFKEISAEPVVAEEEADYAIRNEDLPEIFRQYEILADELILRRKKGYGFNFFHFNINLSGGPCVYKRVTGCGSGSEYMAVSPDGSLYPCHQFVGEEEYKLGDVINGIKNYKIVEEFKSCNVYTKKGCSDCWAKFYCSGGCMANAYHADGSIFGEYAMGCKMQKKRIEMAIYIKAKELLG